MSKFNPPYLGAAYYPEDWPLEQIDQDIALMKEAGTNVMRVAEFAWSRMEPEEGRFDFDWLHLVVDKLAEAVIATIMCTPSCTPPIWLVERYPEVLFIMEDGRPMQHGSRRHACPNSPVYREHCERIVTKMAEEFGQDDRIIGWQIDNEVFSSGKRGRSCQCPVCVDKFHESMKRKFGTIENLNASWGMDLWSQTYQSFEQLPTPNTDIWHHPSLLTAWSEFNSDSYVEFVKHQADILHKLTHHPIGTDMMPFTGLDHGHMNRNLDLVQFNHYNGKDNLWQAAFWFDHFRPMKERPFWNTETQTCWSGSTSANGYQEPGFCRVNSWMPIALGGEANLYWLWRQHWSGQELMHGAVVSSCGRPLHIINEVREISQGFQKASEFLNNTRPTTTGLAVHFSPRAGRMFDYQPLVNGFSYTDAFMNRVYHPLIQSQLRPDVIHPMIDLSEYKIIISPFLMSLDEEGLRDRLKNWIEDGGTWVVGPMSDIRNEHLAKFTYAPYGSLEEWAGVYCRYEIPGDPREFALRWQDGRESTGSVWYDGLEPRGSEALASYTEGPFEGLAAVTSRKMGKGQVVMLGTMPQPEDLQSLILALAEENGIRPVAEASENLLVVPRSGEGGKGFVVVELENRSGEIVLPSKMKDILSGAVLEGRTSVEPYKVMVLVDVEGGTND